MGFSAGGPYSVVERILTSAEVLALGTTAIELLPAKVGCLYLPYYISLYKPAGVAYTAANMVLENADGIQFATVAGVGFLDQTAAAVHAEKVSGGKIRELGNNLQLRLLTATASGDQDVRVKLLYIEEYPGLL